MGKEYDIIFNKKEEVDTHVAIRDILHEGDETLRKISKPVAQVDGYIQRLLDDMLETMRQADGCGLAAPQVGVLRRVVVVEVEGEVFELINPEIISAEGEVTDAEGCLSVPGRAGLVTRPQTVTVRATGRDGQVHEYTGQGLLARAFCHELDHLDGILYIDKMIEELEMEDED